MIWMVLLMTVMKFQEFQFDLKLQADLIWTSSDLRQLSIWFVKVSTTAEWWWWWKQLSIINDYDDDDSYHQKHSQKNMKTLQEVRKLPVTSYQESQV